MQKVNVIISIIIPDKNGEKFLNRCLVSIFEEKANNYEVIVIDDGSKDKSAEILNSYQKKEEKLKVIFLPENSGAALARNIGVKNSKGKYLFFLDNDTKVKLGWLKNIPLFFEKNPQTAIGQVKLLKMGTNNFDYAGDFMSNFGFLVERARSAEDVGQFDRFDKVFAVKSAGMIMRKDVFEKVSGFDPDYIFMCEDTDICWRTWLAGYEVRFAYNITVWHAYGTKEKGQNFYLSNNTQFHGVKNTLINIIKNSSWQNLFFWLPLDTFVWFWLSIGFLISGNKKKAVAIIKGLNYIIFRFFNIFKKRKEVNLLRKISDKKLFAQIGKKINFRYLIGKALAYVREKPF